MLKHWAILKGAFGTGGVQMDGTCADTGNGEQDGRPLTPALSPSDGAREQEGAQRGGSGETFGRCCGLESSRSGTEGRPLTPALSPSDGAREQEGAQRGGSGETFVRCCGLESPRSGTEGKPLTPALSPSDGAREQGKPLTPALSPWDGAREERRSVEQGCAAKPTRPALLRFEGLQKRYGAVAALGGIDLSVAGGSVLALLGPNGAGKSTLFGCLLGLVRPTAGAVHFQGQPIKESDRARFGYLAERIALYPQRTVRENGLFFARLKQQPAAELERQLKRVGLHAVQDRPVRQLSKGMLQRLGLAIALCGQPDLLVLDEPFNGLDPALLDGLQRILREEQARGATLLISTHTMSAIEPLATHVAILLQGRLALSGTLDALRAGHGEEESLEMIYHRIARQNRGANPEEVL